MTKVAQNINTVRIGIILLAILGVFYAGTNLWAYTYTYHNSSSYKIRIVAEFYGDEVRTIQINANKLEAISTQCLLKSWVVEAFFDNVWKQVLNFTCDVLPGDHTFSIYVKEAKDDKGKTIRAWNAIADGEDVVR